jgi:hypothetical protein
MQKVYKEGRVKVNEEEFFLKLVEVSCGPTVEKWKKDGYNGVRYIFKYIFGKQSLTYGFYDEKIAAVVR